MESSINKQRENTSKKILEDIENSNNELRDSNKKETNIIKDLQTNDIESNIGETANSTLNSVKTYVENNGYSKKQLSTIYIYGIVIGVIICILLALCIFRKHHNK